jgi:iron complex transport system ATP-binding protein
VTTLQAISAVVRYDARPVLRDVNVTIEKHGIVGIIGPNGAGKTTLLRALACLVPLERGEIRVNDIPAASLSRREAARRIAFLPSEPPVHWPLSVRRIVSLGRMPHIEPWRQPSDTDGAAVERAMRETGVLHLAGRAITGLSSGERARALMARALAVEPEYLLADEPVASLDPFHQLQVMELLQAYARGGRGIAIVLHDLALASRFCDRVVVIADGGIVREGPTADVLVPATVRSVYGVETAEFTIEGRTMVFPWRRVQQDEGSGSRA